MTLLVERQIGHGDAVVSYGDGERPKYKALARAIDAFYQDLLLPLERLREAAFLALPFADVAKQEEPYRYTAKQRRLIDLAIDLFLTEMAGPDRSREGYVTGGMESDTPDGVLQQRQVFSYAIGLRRAADLLNQTSTLTPGRQDPAVLKMLDGAFARLSENGKLRLEAVRDDIHSILVTATDAGLSPLETGRLLSGRFDQYQRFEFERLARTEAAFAAEAGNRDQMKEFGVEFVVWLISGNSCPLCEAYVGRLIAIDDTENHPPRHPNCACSLRPAGPEDLLR